MSPTGSTFLKRSTFIPQSSRAHTNAIYHIDDDRDESVHAEIDDEQIRHVLISPLFFQEGEAGAGPRQTYQVCFNVLSVGFRMNGETRIRPDSKAEIQPRIG